MNNYFHTHTHTHINVHVVANANHVMTTIQTNAVATIYVHQLKYIFLLWQTTKNTLIIEPHNANKKHMILRRHCWILFHEWVRERVTTDQSGFIKITATATATTMANIEMDFGHCCSSIWMNKRKPSNAFSSNKRMSRARFNILYCCGGSSSGGSLSFVENICLAFILFELI